MLAAGVPVAFSPRCPKGQITDSSSEQRHVLESLQADRVKKLII
jgi:hypothetical protein